MSQMGDCEIGNVACESARTTSFWRVVLVEVLLFMMLALGVDRLWRR